MFIKYIYKLPILDRVLSLLLLIKKTILFTSYLLATSINSKFFPIKFDEKMNHGTIKDKKMRMS